MSDETTVREAIQADCESVLPLAKAMATSFEVEKDAFILSFSDISKDPAAVCFVAENGGEIIGYLLGFEHRAFYANGCVSWVEEIFVKADLRRMGIGKKLMDRFETWCMDRGSCLVGLATRRASGFYNSIGYEESAIFFRRLLKRNAQPGEAGNA